MPRDLDARPLRGGAIRRAIIRDGDVVVRPAGSWTPAVHEYLLQLRAAGLLVPEPLGVEGEFESLRYIDGEPLWAPGDRTFFASGDVAEFGRLLRHYHEVSSRLEVDQSAPWNRLPLEADPPYEVVCHNDFAPWNVLRTSDGLAIIDWDLAAPGTREWDLAHAAWTGAPLWNDRDIAARGLDPIADRADRLASLLDAYGADSAQRLSLLAAVEQRLEAAIAHAERWSNEGRPGWREQWSLPEPYRHGGGFRRDIAFLAAVQAELKPAIAG